MKDLQASINVQMGRLEALNTEFDNATANKRDTCLIQRERIATLNLLADLIHEQYAADNDGEHCNYPNLSLKLLRSSLRPFLTYIYSFLTFLLSPSLRCLHICYSNSNIYRQWHYEPIETAFAITSQSNNLLLTTAHIISQPYNAGMTIGLV